VEESVSLREYIERCIDDLKELLDERFQTHHELHEGEKQSLADRLNRLNELRELVGEIREGYVTREFYDTQHKSISAEVGLLRDRMGSLEGRFLGIALAATLLGAVALVVSLLNG